MARVAAASLDIRPRRHIGREVRFRTEHRRVEKRDALPVELLPGVGQGGGLRSRDLLLPRQADYQAFPLPVLVERAGRLELPYLLIRNQAFIQLNYARLLVGLAGHDPRVAILKGSYPVQLDDGPKKWLPDQDSNLD